MSGFFNYDNPVWRFIGKFWDLILLNVLFVVCSVPIFTIGASTTAVYYVTLKLVRDEEGYTIRSFFKSFKENFKQATIIWLVLMAAGCILFLDFLFFVRIPSGTMTFRTVMLAIFGGMTIVWGAITLYVFPLQARFYNTIKRTLFNAFFMSIRHFLQTIGMAAINVSVVVLALFVIPQIGILLILFGFPLLAFINSFFLNHVFERYMPGDEPEDRELRPLFENEQEPEQDGEKQ